MKRAFSWESVVVIAIIGVVLVIPRLSFADQYISEEVRLDSNSEQVNAIVTVDLPKVTNVDGNGNIFVIWQRETDVAGILRRLLYFNRSIDNGRTWLQDDVLLSPNPPQPYAGGVDSFTMCHDDGGNLYVAWVNTDRLIHFRHSGDYGATWDDAVTLNGYPDVLEIYTKGPRIACDRHGRVYVMWVAWDLYMHLNYTDDYGATWLAESIAFGPEGEVINPQIDCDENGRVFVSWLDDRDVVIPYTDGYGNDISTVHENTMRYVTITTLPKQLPATDITIDAYPDYSSRSFPDDNMEDYGVGNTVWVGAPFQPEWNVEIDLGKERALDVLEIEWYRWFGSRDFDILATVDGEEIVVVSGLSESPSVLTNPVTTVPLGQLRATKLRIRINEENRIFPVILEVRVKSWD